ncbi:hypothetical protein WT15_07775 [Burkholderia stagnalis]|uniref:FimD/PapC N-terminal domain-containing protein n=1 Tax=Burkholderia stagnalis TaxID=1503054 RepID=UPI000759B051|nr:hypothetical protein WT15_07775 [Burkholderia stagnalis]KWO36839.1 hypothetical protein WT95_07810 [Burkholderia stagnalis]
MRGSGVKGGQNGWDATAQFDNGGQRLDVSVRQASMIRNAREDVNPRDWDEGVSAALLKYDANVCCTDASAGTSYKQFGAGYRAASPLMAESLAVSSSVRIVS